MEDRIQELTSIVLDKVNNFCQSRFLELNANISPCVFQQKRIALYSITGQLPNCDNPEFEYFLLKKAKLLKILIDSEELTIKGFQKNQSIGKVDVPKNLMADLINILDEEIWGKEGSWGREYMKSEFESLDELIEFHTPKRRKKYSKSSFLGFYCRGWIDYLSIKHIFDTKYKRFLFIYDLLREYGIQLIDETQFSKPTNKDKEEYIKGLMTTYRKVGISFYSKWDDSDPNEWVNFL